MPPLPASKFGQSVVIGRDARGGLFPISLFPARVTVELELRHSSELSSVNGFYKNTQLYSGMQILASGFRGTAPAGERV